MRLDKYLAESLQITRSQSKALLKKGRISVNHVIEKSGDRQINDGDIVCSDGVCLNHSDFVYLMLNKPLGVVSASRDRSDTTVVDLVRNEYPRRELFPAGRLDKTSTGFVLLTDDGKLAHDILAPNRHIPKTYDVVIDTPMTDAMVKGFAEGPTLADGTHLDGAELRAISEDKLTVEVILHQGVYHQIKRMFGLFNAGVNELHRKAIGSLSLDPSLNPGQYRHLTEAEVASLRDSINKSRDSE